MISSGIRPATARFKMYLDSQRLFERASFNEAGMVWANSIRWWSSNGDRVSIECAMLIRSTLTRMSPGRLVLLSRYICRSSLELEIGSSKILSKAASGQWPFNAARNDSEKSDFLASLSKEEIDET